MAKKIYVIEVVKESRALVTGVEAENNAEAAQIAEEKVKSGEVAWSAEDIMSSSIVSTRDKKD